MATTKEKCLVGRYPEGHLDKPHDQCFPSLVLHMSYEVFGLKACW